MSKARIIHDLHDDFGVTISEAEKAYDIAIEYIRLRSAIGDHPEDYEPSEYVLVKASSQPETEERTAKSAQNVSESDMIYRKDAIEAMSESLKRVFPEHRQIAEKCLNALSSAEPTQTNTSNTLKSLDCIDRQDAIDVIAKTYVIHGSAGSWIDHALGALRGLPSAQPETEEQMPETEQNVLNDELISKKEAIDLFLAKGMPTAAVYIERMPSVQPEIIRCRECKHYDGRPCGIVDWYNTADDFCSRAERRQHE